jgi:hypothetical protein
VSRSATVFYSTLSFPYFSGPCRELPLMYNKSATAFQHMD